MMINEPYEPKEPPRRGPKLMELSNIGSALMLIGAAIAVLGGLLWLASKVPGAEGIFNLPGDIKIQTTNFSCFFPIVSMILISIILTVIVNVIIRILNQ